MGMQPILPITVFVKKIKGAAVNGDGVAQCEQAITLTGGTFDLLQALWRAEWVAYPFFPSNVIVTVTVTESLGVNEPWVLFIPWICGDQDVAPDIFFRKNC